MTGDGKRFGDDWTTDDMHDIIINPFAAITISEDLAAEHPPLVSREDWIQANATLIDQLGAEVWLSRLLDVLEHGFSG